MGRVVHFDFEAENVERAQKFYKKVFGWKFKKWDGPMDYWLIMTGNDKEPGIDGGMGKRGKENTGTMNTIDVKSVDAACKAIEKEGGKVVRPKMAVPGVGWMAYCEDTEGNFFGIMQFDEKAK